MSLCVAHQDSVFQGKMCAERKPRGGCEGEVVARPVNHSHSGLLRLCPLCTTGIHTRQVSRSRGLVSTASGFARRLCLR